MERNIYENPLTSRYASPEMSFVWSPQKKFGTWRRLWIALAAAEQKLGLGISDEQLEEMRANAEDINFEVAEAKEKELRHDVMSHVHAFGDQCPKAKPIIHLGATSCFVTDNTELVQIRESLVIVRERLVAIIDALREFALAHRELPTLGFTHFQPAQLTTVGKRAALWLYDFTLDFHEINRLIKELPFRGVKGTTGTQGSFLALFNGDHDKVLELDRLVADELGFESRVPVSGQTYSRKWDWRVLSALSGIAQSSAKMASDVRLLAHLKELEEPFGKKQIGSSAMAYKRNPMRSERVCSLARFVCSLSDNAAQTHSNQWMERTLDDSANRRLSLPQAFLGVDVILKTLTNVAGGMIVWPKVIEKHIMAELPFMATEHIIMAGVQAGGDRQELHEAIRRHSMDAAKKVKEAGGLPNLVDPTLFIGRAAEQVVEFIAADVEPVLKQFPPVKRADELNV